MTGLEPPVPHRKRHARHPTPFSFHNPYTIIV
jgi:hypothetical protein